jgi:hypothetical protein
MDGITCYNCWEQGHIALYCPYPQVSAEERMRRRQIHGAKQLVRTQGDRYPPGRNDPKTAQQLVLETNPRRFRNLSPVRIEDINDDEGVQINTPLTALNCEILAGEGSDNDEVLQMNIIREEEMMAKDTDNTRRIQTGRITKSYRRPTTRSMRSENIQEDDFLNVDHATPGGEKIADPPPPSTKSMVAKKAPQKVVPTMSAGMSNSGRMDLASAFANSPMPQGFTWGQFMYYSPEARAMIARGLRPSPREDDDTKPKNTKKAASTKKKTVRIEETNVIEESIFTPTRDATDHLENYYTHVKVSHDGAKSQGCKFFIRHVLCDGGASVNTIVESVAKQLGVPYERDGFRRKITVGDNRVVTCKTFVRLRVEIRGVVVEGKFFVFTRASPANMILGRPFLHTLKAMQREDDESDVYENSTWADDEVERVYREMKISVDYSDDDSLKGEC